jgi:hypothetical protein
MDNSSFSGVIISENKKGGWTYVVWPESADFFGTRKASKVVAKIGGHEFNVTCLPLGDGTHMLPLSKPVMSSIGKKAGDTIVIDVRKPS